VAIASMPVLLVHHNIRKLEIMVAEEKWISALSVLVGLKTIILAQNFKNMDAIEWLKANYLYVQKCAQQKLFWEAMAIW
jgi:hypothetical protein